VEKYTGEPSLAVTQAEVRARQQRLEDLSTEAPAGPTVMETAHANGMRKAVSLLKSRFADRSKDRAEAGVKAALVIYLREWHDIYKRGVAESASQVDRTILDIRRDTVLQILAEIGRQERQDGKPGPLTSSPHGSGSTGDRPAHGVPPGDF
jgi:hypothetical protein